MDCTIEIETPHTPHNTTTPHNIETPPNIGILHTPPTKSGSRRGRSDIGKQERNIIWNVYRFFQKIAENPDRLELINFRKVQEVTAEACGVGVTTVKRIRRRVDDSDEEVKFDTPRKKYSRDAKVVNMDSFDKDMVRRCVFQFYDNGEYPTSERIRTVLKEKINFSGSVESVRKIIKSLGFRFRKCNDGRQLLMERRDIACARAVFLRKMHEIRREINPRPIFYIDETWVNQNHSRSMIWQHEDGSGGLKVPVGKGGRLIILHAGSAQTGFIPECKLIFKAKKSTSLDYHTEMNADIFTDWFRNFLNLLEESSVIVMDNASYHSALTEKIPRTNWKKVDIQNWLESKNVSFSENETKAELLSRNEIKYAVKEYEIDRIALEMGHEVVRMPPYHAHYNRLSLCGHK
ncbi:uncharacterized protein LOC120353647 [Nilaparvata lugens]|uniref:uncharacterized protein LOC120353647 n=1 Tax=Nilaparvata lugens TaxID=108931 RepID=UPI00193D9B15|nr:uncharacterized protein LOC120353647 [Nilaparvata lugens]